MFTPLEKRKTLTDAPENSATRRAEKDTKGSRTNGRNQFQFIELSSRANDRHGTGNITDIFRSYSVIFLNLAARTHMKIESESLDGGVLKIALAGRMDVQGTQEIDLKFTGYTANQNAVIVDLSAVDFLASIGIRTLLLTAKAVTRRGGKIVLFNPDANVTSILQMAGIDTLVPICRSLDEACSAVAA